MACLVRGVLYPVTPQHLAQVLSAAHYVLRSAEGYAVVLIWQLGPRGGQLVHFQDHLVALPRIYTSV